MGYSIYYRQKKIKILTHLNIIRLIEFDNFPKLIPRDLTLILFTESSSELGVVIFC